MIEINGAGYPLSKILSDDFLFTIPNYQRPYLWGKKETDKLLEDLIDTLGENDTLDISKITPYFLGNIVLIKEIGERDARIIDGQQRLTTITILFAVLRELRKKESLTKYICQPGDEDAGISARPRLLLRDRDQDFFAQYIQDREGINKLKSLDISSFSETQHNIAKNALFLLDEIEKQLPTPERKQRLTQFLLQQCYLVVVSTSDFDSAYKIFSVLNDRGLRLDVTDILKADIIGNITKSLDLDKKNEVEDKYTEIWEDKEEKLGRDNFKELFTHLRMIRAKVKQQQKIIEELRTVFAEDFTKGESFINTILKPYADNFYNIIKCNFKSNKYSSEINQILKYLRRIDHFDWKPPALLFLDKYKNESQKKLKFLTDLERLAVGLMIQRININHRIKRYADVLKAIENQEDLYKKDSPLQLTKDEQIEIEKALNGNIYQQKYNKYVLLRLDELLSDPIIDYDSNNIIITIEHILPQNPDKNSNWLKLFTSEEKRTKYIHCIGNLALLSHRKNPQAQNYDFPKKVEIYLNNPTAIFSLTIRAINEKEWTPEIIEKRQNEYVERLKKIWRINLS